MSTVFSRTALCLIAVGLLLPLQARAAIVPFIDEGTFLAGVPDPISGTEDFSGFFPVTPGGDPAPCDPVASGCAPVTPGIEYGSGGSGLVIIDLNFFNFSEAIGTASLTDSITMVLVGGGTAVGFTLINDDFDFLTDDIVVTFEVFDPSAVSLGTFPGVIALADGGAFFGFTATGGDFIGAVTITPVGTESPLIDGVSFNFGLAPMVMPMPEPGVIALLVGSVGFAAFARRRRRASAGAPSPALG